MGCVGSDGLTSLVGRIRCSWCESGTHLSVNGAKEVVLAVTACFSTTATAQSRFHTVPRSCIRVLS